MAVSNIDNIAEKSDSMAISYKNLFAIVLIAFIIRLFFALIVPTVPISDCSWYEKTAISICDGRSFSIDGEPTAYRTPGYSFALGIIYSIFGKKFVYGYIFNAILGALAVLLLMLLARKFTDKWKTIGWIFALYPEHIIYTNILSSEMLFQVILLLWLLVAVKKKFISNGILAGILTYIRPVALLLPLLAIFWDKRNWKKYIISFVLAIMIIVPWIVRNSSQIGSPVMATNFWVNLWLGNGSQSNGTYFDPQFPRVSSEIEQEKWFRQKTFENVERNPFRPLRNIPIKLAYFSIPVMTAPVWGLAKTIPKKYMIATAILLTLINILVILGAIIGILRKKIPISFLVAIIYFTAIPLIFFGADRYRFPILPLSIFSAVVGYEKLKFRQ
ncbi:DUF2029 domain-containing protein [bacterium]|nr:DUF2029 domain-containing protein [bacterium]